MDHTLHRPQLVHPWRTATVVATLVALAELVLLVAAGAALLGRPVADKVRAAAEAQPPAALKPRPRPASGGPSLPRDETSVLVLNGNGRAGAASAASGRIHSLGYVVGGVGNAPRTDYARSLVMYRPGYRAEAQRLAKDVGVPVVAPLDGMKPRELMGAHLALVLGAA